MKLYTLLSIALLSINGLATAETTDNDLDSTYKTCLSKAVSTSTNEIMECIYSEYKVQDNRLNANYKKLNSQSSKKQKSQLLEAQRAWIKYRDSNCKFYADPDGGTEAMLTSNLCILDTTIARANELEKLN